MATKWKAAVAITGALALGISGGAVAMTTLHDGTGAHHGSSPDTNAHSMMAMMHADHHGSGEDHGHGDGRGHGMGHGGQQGPGHDHDDVAAEHADNPAVQAYMRANDQMHEGMAIAFTGNADVDFALGMIPHHQGAIDMAEAVLEYGDDPEIRALAEEIVAAQESEIAFLRAWLEDNAADASTD